MQQNRVFMLSNESKLSPTTPDRHGATCERLKAACLSSPRGRRHHQLTFIIILICSRSKAIQVTPKSDGYILKPKNWG